MRGTLEQRFWAKVQKTEGCWNWTAGCVRGGYGGIGSGDGRRLQAHRLSYEIEHGPIPDGLWVLHECDNPKCVRPSHLYLGDHQKNMDDRTKRKRHWANQRPEEFRQHIMRSAYRDGFPGEKNPAAKITVEQVREIRTSTEMPTRLAARMGITYKALWAIRARKVWKHVA